MTISPMVVCTVSTIKDTKHNLNYEHNKKTLSTICMSVYIIELYCLLIFIVDTSYTSHISWPRWEECWHGLTFEHITWLMRTCKAINANRKNNSIVWFYSFVTGNSLFCGWRFEPAKYITMHVVMRECVFKILLVILMLL